MAASPIQVVARASRSVFGYFVRHRTAANLILLLMLVGGYFASTEIRSQFFPDSVRERVTVTVAWPGAGPDDVDSAIIGLIEPRMLSVEGVEGTDTRAREGSARINVNFEDGWDMGRAVDEVKAAVDLVTGLPGSAEDPVVTRSAFRDRVTDVVIHGPVDADQLTRFAAEFQGLLFREGVTRTSLVGVQEPTIRIATPEAALIRHDISIAEIAAAIGAETDTSPAGDVSSGGTRIRTGEERRSAEEIGAIPAQNQS